MEEINIAFKHQLIVDAINVLLVNQSSEFVSGYIECLGLYINALQLCATEDKSDENVLDVIAELTMANIDAIAPYLEGS